MSRRASPQHCTDLFCSVIFLICLAGYAAVLVYAIRNGDIRRLFHGMSYEGQLCGVDVPEPFLYYCHADGGLGQLDMERPICVDACPTHQGTEKETCADGLTINYDTEAIAGRYCLPTSKILLEQVNAKFGGHKFERYLSKLSMIPEAWLPLLLSALIALIIGFAYLYLMEKLAAPMVWSCLLIAILVPLAIGSYLIFVSVRPGDGFDGVPDTGDSQYNLYLGIGISAVGLLLLLVTCCSMHGVETAIACVKVAIECMLDMPTMLLAPVIDIVFKVLIGTVMFVGFLQLASAGEIENVNGLYRRISYPPELYGCLAFYVFMMLWVLELSTAMMQFALAYATQGWYFTPIKSGHKSGAPGFALFRGYCNGFGYHLGTLLFGAFLIACFRLVRMVLSWIAQKSKETGNVVGECIDKACLCMITCFQRIVEFVNKNAYIDCAISSNSFCAAARHALTIIISEVKAVAILNGATWVLQLAGVAVIGAAGAATVWLMLREISAFNDPNSDHYVNDPAMVTGVAGVICICIGASIMSVFDVVSDTILYCFALDNKEGASKKSSKQISNGSTTSTRGLFSCACTGPSSGMAGLHDQGDEYAPPALRKLLAEHR